MNKIAYFVIILNLAGQTQGMVSNRDKPELQEKILYMRYKQCYKNCLAVISHFYMVKPHEAYIKCLNGCDDFHLPKLFLSYKPIDKNPEKSSDK